MRTNFAFFVQAPNLSIAIPAKKSIRIEKIMIKIYLGSPHA
ncbi:hypothetical protein FACS1894120_2690 [Clostridia bacterium]|nr:hypothetical protein FACS1894120_2690 [Clostridia bacterium]